MNLSTPQQKLRTKTRVGAKVTETYDRAQTPYQRLLSHPGVLDKVDATGSPPNCRPRTGRRRRGRRPLQHLVGQGPPQDRHRRAQTATVYESKIKINNEPENRATPDESTTQTSWYLDMSHGT